MTSTITRQDPRYSLLRRGKNARWPATDADSVSRIEIVATADDVAPALQSIVAAGLRPTVRSGGHCYEDFVANNPNGVILDVSMLNHTSAAPDGKSGFQVGAGAVLGVAYAELYKKYNVTMPGGSCYSVAAGGHVSGGGYGVLSRKFGLVTDWLTAVDICTVEANGKVVKRHVDAKHDADLFRACRGAGGSSFGVITNFYFETLPPAPHELASAGVSFPWDTMTEEKFIKIVKTYGDYFETRGKDKDTWGLFTFMGLTHKSAGGIGVSATFHDAGPTVEDLSIPNEFLDRFVACGGAEAVANPPMVAHRPDRRGRPQLPPCTAGKHSFNRRDWYSATVDQGSGSGVGNTRGKYKSCYMRKNFTTEEAKRLYKHLTRESTTDMSGLICAVDSYGGATNVAERVSDTSVPQRDSIMKLQYQSYWSDPAEDADKVKFLDEMYTDVYSANVDAVHAGTPYPNEFYEGCYINYPDVDMMRYPFWSEVYYGKGDLYGFLQGVKKKYDPNNIFHNAMSIRPKA
ncbi:FAD-dependent oxidoreductase [Granulicella sibirica]|uniref:FAD-binding PCMH-type domain-containing protein n=1 Tax=Granulicella sibirica TaxID=2479048 RepID=A0A4Q0SYI3_9BACT|nr:FAD-binding oxidoreductase [Granulicella sibirica]RXH56303.1 hypothetical protein GRAN_3160 [Granulicella sibirica]